MATTCPATEENRLTCAASRHASQLLVQFDCNRNMTLECHAAGTTRASLWSGPRAKLSQSRRHQPMIECQKPPASVTGRTQTGGSMSAKALIARFCALVLALGGLSLAPARAQAPA